MVSININFLHITMKFFFVNSEALLRVHPWMFRVNRAEWTFSRTGLSF